MDYLAKALEAIGKAIDDKDREIQSLRWNNDFKQKRIEEMEEKLKSCETAKEERRE